ncbi:hypothetical protein DBV14_14790 [Variovorax sp. KBW07]|nr:hypothetical protein DBV14_14790 [Variovorax sp. KBW07]
MHFNIGLEMTCIVSLIGANSVELEFGRDRSFGFEDHQGPFDRHTLTLPDVLVPAHLTPEAAMRPVFDLMWQSAGFERPSNYNTAGE